ncbi:DNA-directed RNA polymerases I like protein [Argiope bruennichi]|nr:DNA-directed RNA polymerases I like protein [Argiope bruennichi]
MDLILDVNTQAYPMDLGDKFGGDRSTEGKGAADDGEYYSILDSGPSRADAFGSSTARYRIEGTTRSGVQGVVPITSSAGLVVPPSKSWRNGEFLSKARAAYVSFGGLLMRLQGDPNNLHGFEVDSHVYLLLKKLAF